MQFETLDIVYLIIIFQLLMFSVFLFVRRAKYLSNYILGLQLIAQAAGIFAGFLYNHLGYLSNNSLSMMYLGYAFEFLWGPTFYLYVKSVVYTDFKLKRLQLIHFIPFAVVCAFFLAGLVPLGIEEKKTVLKTIAYVLDAGGFYLDSFIRMQVLFYIIQSIRVYYNVQNKIKESQSSISKESLSWIRFLIAGFTVSFFVSVTVVMINLYIFNIQASAAKLMIMLPYCIYFNIIFFRAWFQPGIFSGVETNIKYQSSKLTKEEAEGWISRINKYIALNKPYLKPDLTLNQLAEELDISPRILSQIINEYFNQNFYEYINCLRVEESKQMLLASSPKKTVLEILYAVGFNNKSAYYAAFKRATNLTPTDYRKKFTN
ncbi:MAG: helix-turn-helix domain-containing protein [Ignavibacteriales bacterium]